MKKQLLATFLCTMCFATLWPSAPACAETPPDLKSFKFEIASPDRTYSLRFSLAAQLWMVTHDSGSVGGAREQSAVVQVRRVRPTISGTAFSPAFRYMVHVSVTPNAFEFMDLTADYAFTPGFRVRIGQWKIPFTRYRIRSYKNRQVVDWAITAKYFGAERQIGVLLHDGYDSGVPPRCEWAVGVFNGINSRTAHGVGPSMIYEPPTDPEQGRGLHPEVVFRLGYNHGGINTTGEGDLEGGPFRFAVSLGGAVDFAPVFAEDWGIRGAADALIKAHGFSLAGTFYVATVQDGPTLGDQRLGALGAWAATGYVIKKRVEIAGQYAAVIPAQEGEPVHEVRGGVNVFILGRRVQWRTDGGVVLGRDDAGATTDIQMRSILQMTL